MEQVRMSNIMICKTEMLNLKCLKFKDCQGEDRQPQMVF